MRQNSPKTTLLQGQSLKDLYEVITGISPSKKVQFLKICDVSVLDQYTQKKKIKYERDSKKAI